jgi:hypothetical protein
MFKKNRARSPRGDAASTVLNPLSTATVHPVRRVTPEIDIWQAAQLMLKRYAESTARAGEIEAAGDHEAAPSWHLINFAKVPILQKPAVRDRFLSLTNT